jgi:hypothetical protein
MDENRMKDLIHKNVTAMFDEILQFVEVAVPNKYTYDKIRSRILTAGNNTIRDLQRDCDNFDMVYKPKSMEIMDVEQ